MVVFLVDTLMLFGVAMVLYGALTIHIDKRFDQLDETLSEATTEEQVERKC